LVSHNGGYWYWTPDRTWLYFSNGNWQPHRPGVATNVRVAYPVGFPDDDWRLVNQNGRWWYWTPDRNWLLFSGNRWTPFRGARQRQQVGFRGLDDDSTLRQNEVRDDDQGRQFDNRRQADDVQRSADSARPDRPAGQGASERTFEQGEAAGRTPALGSPQGEVTPPMQPPTPGSTSQPGQSGGNAQGATPQSGTPVDQPSRSDGGE
jgi:hypothetical protein